MATIEKRGDSYRIVVSGGYTAKGKQVRERMTWTPPAGMSEEKALKEVKRQAVLFEERVKRGRVVDSKITLDLFFCSPRGKVRKVDTVDIMAVTKRPYLLSFFGAATFSVYI